MAEPKRKLGRGLGALISSAGETTERAAAPGAAQPAPQDAAPVDGYALVEIDPRSVKPNPKQPRVHFDEDALEELADSIRQDGVHEPVVVRRVEDRYELVSGERRVRASVLAELRVIPAIVRDVSDEDMLKLGLIENIQRENLNPIELAQAYQQLAEEFGWTQDEVARQVGKKRATVSNTIRLLNLDDDIQRHVVDGTLSMGHARALLAIDDSRDRARVCNEIVKKGLSVREAEKLAAHGGVKRRRSAPAAKQQSDPHLAAVEDELRKRVGTRVRLTADKEYRGKIELDFYNLEDLERILDLLRS